jgi:hypothetical protein
MFLSTFFAECVYGGPDYKCPSDQSATIFGVLFIVALVVAVVAWVWFQRKFKR